MAFRPVEGKNSSFVDFKGFAADSGDPVSENAQKGSGFSVGSPSGDLGRVNSGNGRSLTKEQVRTMLSEAIARNGIRQTEQLPEAVRTHLDRVVAESGLNDEGKAGLRNALAGKLLEIYGTA